MIELKDDRLVISFPEVHKDARATIEFVRTFRIPDDGKTYPLPPGFKNFALRHVEDYALTAPKEWQAKGGVMMSMYQAEALWLNFGGDYPMAVKIGTGKINAINGEDWSTGLSRSSEASEEWRVSRASGGQNYVVIPEQPWLDGYCVEKGLIRQFVAMPLGQGATVEEQIKGSTDGGMQIQAFPLKAGKWEEILKERRKSQVMYDMVSDDSPDCCYSMAPSMGLAAGGRMKQEIYQDEYAAEDWDTSHTSRCWLHICNSEKWTEITKEKQPHLPYSMEDYTKQDLPWFEYYGEDPALQGSKILNEVRTISEFPFNEATQPFSGKDSLDEDVPF